MRRVFRVIDANGKELFRGTPTYIRRRLAARTRRQGLDGLIIEVGGYDPGAGETTPPHWRRVATAAAWMAKQ